MKDTATTHELAKLVDDNIRRTAELRSPGQRQVFLDECTAIAQAGPDPNQIVEAKRAIDAFCQLCDIAHRDPNAVESLVGPMLAALTLITAHSAAALRDSLDVIHREESSQVTT